MSSAFHIENFGCRAARADGEAVSERLRASGLTEGTPASADVVIVNTCSVTAEADRAARAFIRRAHRLNPDARILVTGCYAQRAPGELAGIGGVAAVVGNSHKAFAPDIAIRLAETAQKQAPARYAGLVPVRSLLASSSAAETPVWVDDRFAHSFLQEAQLIPGTQTRPNLKIQEGCGNRCTFCIIPETRGHSRSLPADSVLAQVRNFVASGGNELVLSGINLGRWGRDLPADHGQPRPSLARLLRRIFLETELPRLRLSSIEPMDWDEDLITLLCDDAGSRLARHAHLPLQSGSDAVLRRMHRRYRPWHYVDKVAALVNSAGPELTVGADVMVGFPGETDSEFEETCQLVRDLPFGYLHLFPFSPRPGTPGWKMHVESPVPLNIVERRMAELRSIAEAKVRSHRNRFLGRSIECITLNTPAAVAVQGRTMALAENFLPVEIDGLLPANQLLNIRVTGLAYDLTLLAVSRSKSQSDCR